MKRWAALCWLFAPQMAAAGVPGLVGSTGNDATLAYMEALPTSRPFLAHLAKVYFSADTNPGCPNDMPRGDDASGDGSPERPYRSFGRMLPLAQQGGFVAVLDVCDVWETNDAGGSGDNESVGYPLGSQRITIVATNVGGDWSVCHDHTKVCFAIIGSDPSGFRRAHVDPDMLDGVGAETAFFYLDDDPALADRNGWLHIENVDWGTPTHPFPRSNGCGESSDFIVGGHTLPFQVSMLHSAVYMCGQNNEVWTSHNESAAFDLAVFVDVDCFMPDVGPDTNMRCFWNIASSAFALIGGKSEFRKVNEVFKWSFDVRLTPGYVTQQNYGFIYDHLCDFRPIDADLVGQRQCFMAGSSLAGTTAPQKLVVARSRCLGGGTTSGANGCLTPVNSIPFDASKARIVDYRNASYDNDSHVSMGAAQMSPDFDFQIKSRCSVHYAGPNGSDRFLDMTSGAAFCQSFDVDVDDFLIDEDSGTVGVVEGVNYSTIRSGATGFCDVAPSASAQNCHGGAWTRCEMTDLSADPFGKGESAGLCATAQCDNDCTEDLVEEFTSGFYLPSHLLDGNATVTGVRLIGRGRPIGPGSVARILDTWTRIGIQFADLARVEASDTGIGVTTLNTTAGDDHLNTLLLATHAANGIPGLSLDSVLPVTDPMVSSGGIVSVRLTGIRPNHGRAGPSGNPGVVGPVSGAIANTISPPGGIATIPSQGMVRICLLVPGCATNLPLDLAETVNGLAQGPGVGGILTIGGLGAIRISILGAPYTVKTVTIFNRTNNGAIQTFTGKGFAHGAMSTTSSTAQTSGVLQLITASHTIVEGVPGNRDISGQFSRVLVHFIPEPGLLLPLGSGAVGMLLLGRKRIRK